MYLHTRELHFVVFVTVMVDEFKSCCNLQAVWAKAWDSSYQNAVRPDSEGMSITVSQDLIREGCSHRSLA